MAGATSERPVASFVLSLVGGLVVLAGGAMVAGLSSGVPYYGGMMGGYYGMMQGLGFGEGWFYGLGALGMVSGIVIVVGAMMIYGNPAKASAWGAVVLAFSMASLLGMGGFLLGSILGVVGGTLAVAWRPRA